jgi:hypothetical protein
MPSLPCLNLSVASVIGFAAGAAMGDELWRQDHSDCAIAPSSCWGGISSQDARNPGGLGWMYEAVDNFDAGAGWTVSTLEFWGAQATTTPWATDGFMIRFYADSSGQVGPLLSTQDVMTFQQETYFTYIPALPLQGFHYTLTLNTPFAVPGAGRYWLSIVAIQPYGGNGPDAGNYRQWGWSPSAAAHLPYSQQNENPPGGGYSSQSSDLAFVLYGTRGIAPCYANCDGSTTAPVLNVVDFTCFLQKYAAVDPYANCDQSTTPPVLNVVDFTCFLQKFAAGCP